MELLSLAKRIYKRTVDPLLSAALTFERKRIHEAVAERMDTLFQVMDQRQHALEADLLRVIERLDKVVSPKVDEAKAREALLAERGEFEDLRREVKALLERVQKARRDTAA